MKRRRILSLVLAFVMAVSVLVPTALAAEALQSETQAEAKPEGKCHGKPEAKEQIAEPEGAVGKDAAKAAALLDAGLSQEETGKVRSRVSDSDGTVVYKVKFTAGGQRYSYKIDALTGEILDKKVSDASESKSHGKDGSESRTRGKGKKAEESTEEAAV